MEQKKIKSQKIKNKKKFGAKKFGAKKFGTQQKNDEKKIILMWKEDTPSWCIQIYCFRQKMKN